MSEGTISSLASLKWTEQLPTKAGHYFVAWPQVYKDSLYQIINLEEGVPYSFDNDWEKYTYMAGQGYLFFGPMVIPDPAVTQHSAIVDNPIQGTDSDV